MDDEEISELRKRANDANEAYQNCRAQRAAAIGNLKRFKEVEPLYLDAKKQMEEADAALEAALWKRAGLREASDRTEDD
jgi:hypothetical protein